MPKTNHKIDITGEQCPMTFIRAKIQLEKMAFGDEVSITLRGGEPLQNVPRAILDHGHQIIEQKALGDDLHLIVVRKCR